MQVAVIGGGNSGVEAAIDLAGVVASTSGKIELEGLGEVREDQVVDKLIQTAVVTTFNRHFPVRQFERLVLAFENGLTIEASAMMPAMDYVHQLSHLDGVSDAIATLGVSGNPAAVASAVEEALRHEARTQLACLSGPDFVEAVTASLEKRDPNFVGR